MENINEFVKYSEIFKDVVNTHLEMYPTVNEYINDYLNKDLTEKHREDAKELYQIITDLEKFKEQHEGVCLESSCLNTAKNDCCVVFYVDNSTSTENGYDADFYLWIFKIDLSEGVIEKYSNDY